MASLKMNDIKSKHSLDFFYGFNEMSDRPISFDDFTIITLDGSFIPLFCGNVGYKTSPLMDTEPFFPKVIFSVVDSKNIEKIVRNRQDLFEFTIQKENISVFKRKILHMVTNTLIFCYNE